MKWRFFLAWLLAIPIAIVNGAIREFGYRRFLAELPAHQLSAVSFILFFGLYVWLISQWLKMGSAREALRIGILWLILTIMFEFVFGHFVMGHAWKILLHDYDIVAGRVWILVLIWIAVAPLAVFHLRERKMRQAA